MQMPSLTEIWLPLSSMYLLKLSLFVYYSSPDHTGHLLSFDLPLPNLPLLNFPNLSNGNSVLAVAQARVILVAPLQISRLSRQ